MIDEVISWLPQFDPDRDQALKRAAGQCRCHKAALLVHSADVVSRTDEVVPELAGVPVCSVDARLPFE